LLVFAVLERIEKLVFNSPTVTDIGELMLDTIFSVILLLLVFWSGKCSQINFGIPTGFGLIPAKKYLINSRISFNLILKNEGNGIEFLTNQLYG
jgi:hypothetical protein